MFHQLSTISFVNSALKRPLCNSTTDLETIDGVQQPRANFMKVGSKVLKSDEEGKSVRVQTSVGHKDNY